MRSALTYYYYPGSGKESPASIVSAFKSRVTTDGGVVEAEEYLKDSIQELMDKGVWDKLSAAWIPSGYAERKLYAIKGGPEADFGFTRAGTRTRVGPSGLVEEVPLHVPAIDFTGGAPKLSLDPGRTNLFLHSHELNNLSKNNTTVQSNVTVAPDGTLSADKVVEDSTSNIHRIVGPGNTLGETFTVSGYIKSAGNNRYLQLLGFGLGGVGEVPVFNPDTGTVAKPATNTYLKSAEMYPVLDHLGLPTGWYRFIAVVLSNNGGAMYLNLTNNPTDTSSSSGTSYLGDGASGLYLWGCQLEQGSYATSYIPTGASTASRIVDGINTLTGIEHLIGQGSGSVMWEGSAHYENVNRDINIRSNNNSSQIRLRLSTSNNIQTTIVANSVSIANYNHSFTEGTNYKVCVTYTPERVAVFINGVKVYDVAVTDSPTDMDRITPSNLWGIDYKVPLILSKEVFPDEQAITLTQP